MTLFQKPNSEG